jgi:hypothetical protein
MVDRSGDDTVLLELLVGRPRVDEHRAVLRGGVCLGGRQPLQPRAGLGEQRVGGLPGHESRM